MIFQLIVGPEKEKALTVLLAIKLGDLGHVDSLVWFKPRYWGAGTLVIVR